MVEPTSAVADETADHKDIVIIVNAEPKTVQSRIVSYEEVVKLAYPTPPSPETRYTVSYRKAEKPREGSLAPGQSVEVKKEGTIFNVKPTGKS